MTESATILIVDDEAFNVDLLEQELEDMGYLTRAARNGQEAIEAVHDQAPDLILLDVMMPVMDGFQCCRALKEDPETRLIPIVIMTALDGFEDRIKGIEAGADDFLTKPVNERELRARIRTALRYKQAVDQKVDEIHRIKDHFAKYVPRQVVELVTANPEAPELAKQTRDVSILFLDISGYARLAEKIAPETLDGLVERYFSAYLDRIHEAGGDIGYTAGDGLMAIFEDAERGGHAALAAETAFALFALTGALNRENQVQPLELHMGLSSGDALVGSTRFEGQYGARWVFTANGTVINLAARLAGIAGEGELIVSAETARRLGDRYPLEDRGRQQLKNLEDPVEVYLLKEGAS
ncbi:MAG: response regulator [Pseudomonadota bacterium]